MKLVKLEYVERMALSFAVGGCRDSEKRLRKVGLEILRKRGKAAGRFEIVDLRKGLIAIHEGDVAGVDSVVERADGEVVGEEARDGGIGGVSKDSGEDGVGERREYPAHD